MRFASRKDKNHWSIAGALQRQGAEVFDTSALGDGFPDMVVMYPMPSGRKRGKIRLVEVKSDTSYGKKGLNDRQSALERRGWPIDVAYDSDDVDTLIAQWRKR